MDGFAGTIRRQAAEVLRTLQGQEAAMVTDPIIELVAHLLDAEMGDSPTIPADFAMTEQWICWNRLLAERPRAVRAAINATLEWEKPPLPTVEVMMRVWAARLVLGTLDRLSMT